MKAIYGYSFNPVTWTEEIEKHFNSTYSTPFINRNALKSIACVECVGLVCSLLAHPTETGNAWGGIIETSS